MKKPRGSVTVKRGKWFARITWTDFDGRRRERSRYCTSKREATGWCKRWRDEWERTGKIIPEGH